MDLKINYGKTREVGANVTSKNSDFIEKLNSIKNINNELKTYWEGTDASTYSTAVEEQLALMTQLSNAIEETGAFLVKIANAYEEACRTNVNGASGGSGGNAGSAGVSSSNYTY